MFPILKVWDILHKPVVNLRNRHFSIFSRQYCRCDKLCIRGPFPGIDTASRLIFAWQLVQAFLLIQRIYFRVLFFDLIFFCESTGKLDFLILLYLNQSLSITVQRKCGVDFTWNLRLNCFVGTFWSVFFMDFMAQLIRYTFDYGHFTCFARCLCFAFTAVDKSACVRYLQWMLASPQTVLRCNSCVSPRQHFGSPFFSFQQTYAQRIHVGVRKIDLGPCWLSIIYWQKSRDVERARFTTTRAVHRWSVHWTPTSRTNYSISIVPYTRNRNILNMQLKKVNKQ